jgi:ribosomal protein S18
MSDEAAGIALNAIGRQDTYLTRDDPKYSLFTYGMKRHANFVKFHRNTQVSNPDTKPTWPFGETIKVTMNPRNMGDLLSNMYVHIEFPGFDGYSHLADQLGRHLIESVTMRVDELVVEKYHDDWGIIYDELYLDASEKRTKRYTMNRNLAEDTSLLEDNEFLVYSDSELMIPIPLFFSRKYEGDEYTTNKPNRPYFPTCAIHKQKIEFDITFRPQSFFTDYDGVATLKKFNVITEEMTVSHQERTYLMTQRQILITDIVKRHPSVQTVIGDDKVKIELVPDIPVKTINWFLRKSVFEDENVYGDGVNFLTDAFANRFNFSVSDIYSPTTSFFEPVMESAKIFIKGQNLPNVSLADHTFFKYIVPFNSRLARPIRNIYTYAFSMNPINVEPSGSLDFSQLQSNRTLLDITLTKGLSEVYTLHIYYVGYQTFVFDQGFMSLAY